MKVRIHGKNLPKKFRHGVFGMTHLTMRDLLNNRRVVNNLEIDIHFRHHADNGEAMIHENEFRSRPRMFRVIIDPYKTRIDDYGREMDDEEHANEMFKVLGHELVHVKQYALGELTTDRYGALRYNGVHYNPQNLLEYFDLPYEIEAYGKEKGLLVGFLAVWKNIEEELL